MPAQLTSQCCPKCGHVSKQNRPNKGLMFRCVACNHELHSDLVGARTDPAWVIKVSEKGRPFHCSPERDVTLSRHTAPQ